MKFLKVVAIAAVFVGVSAPQIASAAEVDVKFSPRIQKDLNRIDNLEKRREVFFRKYREEGANRRPNRMPNVSRFNGTEFGMERLIPEVEDFSVTALAEAMAAKGLESAKDHDAANKLVVEIDEFYAANYSVSTYRSFNTRMSGTVSLVDPTGKTIASEEVNTVILPQFSGSISYTGPEYAFLRQSMDVRMGPILATFIEKGIEGLYPDADVPGPVFLRTR